MTTPPSKQLNGGWPSSSGVLSADNLLFNNVHERALGLAPMFPVLIVTLIMAFWGQRPVPGTVIAVGCFLWAFVFVFGYWKAAVVEELSIDFSQRDYRVRRGVWPCVRTKVGSLSEVRHLRRVVRSYQRAGHGGHLTGFFTYCVHVTMVWNNNYPEEFELKCEESQTKTNNELEPYTTALAARLLVPVMDDTNCAT